MSVLLLSACSCSKMGHCRLNVSFVKEVVYLQYFVETTLTFKNRRLTYRSPSKLSDVLNSMYDLTISMVLPGFQMTILQILAIRRASRQRRQVFNRPSDKMLQQLPQLQQLLPQQHLPQHQMLPRRHHNP